MRELVDEFISLFEDLLKFSWVQDPETVQLPALSTGVLDIFESEVDEESLRESGLKDQSGPLQRLHPCLTLSGKVLDQAWRVAVANARHEDVGALAPSVVLKVKWLYLVAEISQGLLGDLHAPFDSVGAGDEGALLEDADLDGGLVFGLHHLEVVLFPWERRRERIIFVHFGVRLNFDAGDEIVYRAAHGA